ncbi:MAG: PD-(D/E)XK nuclease family protein, partial [Gammaproteobacteria bacterium]|nr:PD-(D/E)XK nuclease family protein [Gammaproteobacteria bacterium]
MYQQPLVLSYSQIDLFEKCPKLWEYLYVEGRTLPSDPNLEFGKAVHYAIAQALKDDAYEHDPYFVEHPASQPLVKVMVENAVNHIHDLKFISGIEIEKMMPDKEYVESVGFRGIIDVLGIDTDGDFHVFDWKTSSRDYSSHDVMTSHQLTAYAYLLYITKGMIPRTVRFCVLDKNFGHLTEYISDRWNTDIDVWANKISVVRW